MKDVPRSFEGHSGFKTNERQLCSEQWSAEQTKRYWRHSSAASFTALHYVIVMQSAAATDITLIASYLTQQHVPTYVLLRYVAANLLITIGVATVYIIILQFVIYSVSQKSPPPETFCNIFT